MVACWCLSWILSKPCNVFHFLFIFLSLLISQYLFFLSLLHPLWVLFNLLCTVFFSPSKSLDVTCPLFPIMRMVNRYFPFRTQINGQCFRKSLMPQPKSGCSVSTSKVSKPPLWCIYYTWYYLFYSCVFCLQSQTAKSQITRQGLFNIISPMPWP